MQICFLLYQGSLCPSLENYSISTHPHILALPPHFFLIWTHGTPTVSCWIECPHKRPFSIATDRLLKRKKEETEVDPFFQQMLSRYCCYWEQNWNYMQLSLWQWSLFWTQAVKASRPGVSPGFPEWPPAFIRQIFCVPAVKAMKQTASVQSLQSAQTAAVEQVTAFRP